MDTQTAMEQLMKILLSQDVPVSYVPVVEAQNEVLLYFIISCVCIKTYIVCQIPRQVPQERLPWHLIPFASSCTFLLGKCFSTAF